MSSAERGPRAGSAPAASRWVTLRSERRKTAAPSAVCPRSLTRAVSAFRSSSARTVSGWSWYAASISSESPASFVRLTGIPASTASASRAVSPARARSNIERRKASSSSVSVTVLSGDRGGETLPHAVGAEELRHVREDLRRVVLEHDSRARGAACGVERRVPASPGPDDLRVAVALLDHEDDAWVDDTAGRAGLRVPGRRRVRTGRRAGREKQRVELHGTRGEERALGDQAAVRVDRTAGRRDQQRHHAGGEDGLADQAHAVEVGGVDHDPDRAPV